MTLVTFNENIDHYVKGDVVDLDAAELKRLLAYAKEQDIKNPYAKGAKDVSNTTDTPSLQDQVAADSLKKGGKETGNDKTDNEDAGTEGVPVEDVTNEANRQAGAGDVEETGSDEESETETATELENDNDEPAQGTEKAKPATAPAKK